MSNQVYSNLEQRKRYPLTGQIVENPEQEITTINGDLHLPDLVYDTLNDDVVSVDSVGLLYKTTKINLLENTDALIKSVELTEDPLLNEANTKALSFNDTTGKIEMTTLGGGGNPFDQDLNTTNIVQFNKIGINQPYSNGSSTLPVLRLRNIDSPNASSWGCRTEYFLSSNPLHPYMSINVSRPTDQNLTFGNYWNGTTWISSLNLSSFKWQRDNDRFNFAMTEGAQIAFAPVQNERIPCYFQANANLGFYVDNSQNGGLYLLTPDVNNANTQFLTRDSITGKTQISAAPNPFNQDLNTTDDVQFNKLTIKNGAFDPSVNADICINSTTVSSLVIDASGGLYPSLSISDRVINGAGTSFGFGFYRDTSGVARASESNFVEIAKAHGGNRLFMAGSSVAQTPGNILTGAVAIASFGVDDILFTSPLKMNTVNLDNSQNKLLVLDSITNIVEYRDVSSLPTGGDVDGAASSTDNAIVRFDGITGKLIQNSTVSVSDTGDITTTGTVNCTTPTLAAEFEPTYIIIKHADDTLKEVSRVNLFGQDLTDFDNVVFNSLTAPTLQTDTIIENTVNGGVKVGAWDLKTQKITSDALVSVPNPLTVSLEYFGDVNSSLALYAENHDNNGLLFDMNHADGVGTTNDFLSGSVNGNVFINKSGGDLDFLFQNGITKGALVDKTAMVNTMSLSKTSINLNQTVSVGQGLICDNLTEDDGTNTYYLTQKDSTKEVMREPIFVPAYGSIGILNSVAPTAIITVDVWAPVILVGTSSPVKNITQIGSTDLQVGIAGIYKIDYNFSISAGENGARDVEMSVFLNNTSTITASIMSLNFRHDTNYAVASQSFMFSASVNDSFSLYVRNRTDNGNLIIQTGNMTIHRLVE